MKQGVQLTPTVYSCESQIIIGDLAELFGCATGLQRGRFFPLRTLSRWLDTICQIRFSDFQWMLRFGGHNVGRGLTHNTVESESVWGLCQAYFQCHLTCSLFWILRNTGPER